MRRLRSPPPAVAEACVDTAKKCKKKHCTKANKAKKCALFCGLCDASPAGEACEDKKGNWCVKKSKNAKKLSKLCSGSNKAKKCEATCELC